MGRGLHRAATVSATCLEPIHRGLQFEASTPCVLRRFLLFGYGDIIIRLLNGSEIARVNGVFFAESHAELMRRRFFSEQADNGTAPARPRSRFSPDRNATPRSVSDPRTDEEQAVIDAAANDDENAAEAASQSGTV